MPRRGHTEEIHIHIRGHAAETQPMLASELEDLVHRILNFGFRHARSAGGGAPGQTRVRLALKLEPIEFVTDFSSHPMGEQLKELAKSRTRGISLGRLRKKHPGWLLEYIATQVNSEDNYFTDESLTRRLLTEQD